MKNRNGFTLVELLAVIAILAILVIIALPNVLKMFREAKVNTFTNEVQNIMRSAESKYVSSSIGNKEMRCFDSSTNVLNLDGRSNILYVVKFNDKGKIIEVRARDEANELIANNSSGIQREDIGKKYKVEAAKTSITDCDGNQLIDGEKVVYKESELNGADPVLGSGMIPVMLSDTGVATYADEYDEWYKYTEKKWANAVILVDKPSKEYTEGDTILESDIRAYFVWIPKYSYRIFNLGNYDNIVESKPETQKQQIEIEFGTRTTVNDEIKKECASPMISGETGDCDIGDLMTHPAFLSIPSNGFWVGKFDTGYNQNSDPSNPITNDNIKGWDAINSKVNSNDSSKLIIRPNVYSWVGQNAYNMFMSAYNFNRNLDSHMIKNTEWAAVLYLSHSKYGIGEEVKVNNMTNYMTGYAYLLSKEVSDVDTTPWNTSNGHKASTTGNISGVYDMAGGSWDFVLAYIDGKGTINNSGFSDEDFSTYSKYFDKYKAGKFDSKDFNLRILGDATGELGPFYQVGTTTSCYLSTWYDKNGCTFLATSPFMVRGGNGNDGQGNGQFRFSRRPGSIDSAASGRVVLNIK